MLVSEIVTNATEHVPGDEDIVITVSPQGDRVRVEVTDVHFRTAPRRP